MMDSETFRRLLSRFASGIAIITARDGERDVGMTVSAFCSVSLSPPLVLVCVDHSASMHALLLEHPKLGISIMACDHEAECRRFADKNETQRFAAASGTTAIIRRTARRYAATCSELSSFPAIDARAVSN